MARSAHFTLTTGAVTATLLPSASIFYGIVASNNLSAADYYVKLYWEGTGTALPGPGGQRQAATTLPVAGTTIPHLTIPVGYAVGTAGGGLSLISTVPLNNGGRIWYWVSLNPGDTDATVLATGGDVVTLIYD